MENPWKIVAIIFMVLFAVTAVICISGVSVLDAASSPLFSKSSIKSTSSAERAVKFIQTNIVQSGTTVQLIDITEESGLYRLTLLVRSADNQAEPLAVFVTKDGRYLFPSTFQLNQVSLTPSSALPAQTTSPAAASVNTCNSVTKADSPVLEAFVVSYCPYGQQMQRLLASLFSSLPSLSAHTKVRYLGTISNGTVMSMHGPTEAAENLRQICIREEQSDRYWNYVSCFLNSTSSASCQSQAEVDSAKLSACIASPDRGISYAANDFRLANSYGATASPTLVLNGAMVSEFSFGGRNPDAIKSIICCGYTNRPEICNTALSTTSATSAGTCV